MPKVTFLVNSYGKPENLWCVLGSLIQQTDPDWNAIVLLNHPDIEVQNRHGRIINAMNNGDGRLSSKVSWDPRFSWDCYWACEWAVDRGLAKGDWICCASDDGYYLPEFVEEMTKSDKDLVICDLLTDKRHLGRRMVMNCLPKREHVDKTNFLVRREKWIGFPHKNTNMAGPSAADGQAVQLMVESGYKWDKIDLPLVVHN